MGNIKILLLLVLILSGCRADDLSIPFPDDRYKIDNHVDDVEESRVRRADPLEFQEDIYFNGGTLFDLAEYLRLKTKYNLVTDVQSLEIVGKYSGGPSKILSDISLAYNLNISRLDNTFYLLKENSDIFNVSIMLDCPFDETTVKTLIHDDNLLFVNGLILFNGSLNRAVQLQSIIDNLKSASKYSHNYVVTVVQTETSKALAYSLQAEIRSLGVDVFSKNVSLFDVFAAIPSIDGTRVNFDNYHERQFYVSNGQSITYNQTTDKQLEERSISDAGTSTVSGYRQLQAGSIIDLKVVSSSGLNVFCDYDIELSSFESGKLDKHVVKVKSERVNLELGKIFYLASSQEKNDSKSFNIIGLGQDNTDYVTTIFVKIDKIN